MKRTIRKQTQQDFFTRIERLDPAFASKAPSERFDDRPWERQKKTGWRAESPFMMAALGAGAAIAILLGFQNPDGFSALLLQTGWPAQFLSYAMNGAAIISFGLVLLLIVNVLRIVNPRATGRWNAAGIVAGAVAGIALFNMPASYVDAGYAFLGFEDANDVLVYAQARTQDFTNVDWSSVVMVSSSAK